MYLMKFLLMRIRLLLTHKQHEDINNKMLFCWRLTKAMAKDEEDIE